MSQNTVGISILASIFNIIDDMPQGHGALLVALGEDRAGMVVAGNDWGLGIPARNFMECLVRVTARRLT